MAHRAKHLRRNWTPERLAAAGVKPTESAWVALEEKMRQKPTPQRRESTRRVVLPVVRFLRAAAR